MRCLKPLSLSERRPEHFLTMLERRAENMHLCDRPPVLLVAAIVRQDVFRSRFVPTQDNRLFRCFSRIANVLAHKSFAL